MGLLGERLMEHRGHKLEVTTYGYDVALECADCNAVLFDTDLYELEDVESHWSAYELLREVDDKQGLGIFEAFAYTESTPTEEDCREIVQGLIRHCTLSDVREVLEDFPTADLRDLPSF